MTGLKQRFVDQDSIFLQHLRVLPIKKRKSSRSMARKWKQINKFVEIFSGALAQIKPQAEGLRVVDFGSGKGLSDLCFEYRRYAKTWSDAGCHGGRDESRKWLNSARMSRSNLVLISWTFSRGDVAYYMHRNVWM